MAVVTRSQTRAAAAAAASAAACGSSATRADTVQNQTDASVRGNAVRGANAKRASTRGRSTRSTRAQDPQNCNEGEASKLAAPCPSGLSKPKNLSRRNGKNSASQLPTAQACGLQFERVTSNNIAGPSSQPLPSALTEAPGVPGRKTQKGRRRGTTSKRAASKAKAKASWPEQQKSENEKTGIAKVGTKRRREDVEHQPEETCEDCDAPTRTLRRVRRRTEKAAAIDTPVHDTAAEAENHVRRNKGKAKLVDLPSAEEASVGSKRRRDEDGTDAGDILQAALDPGPSRRSTRRTRQKVEGPVGMEPEMKPARKPRGRGTSAPRKASKGQGTKRGRRDVNLPEPSRASTPLSCKSEEPMSPSPCGQSNHRSGLLNDSEAEKPSTPPKTRAGEVVVKQEELTPSPLLQATVPTECKGEPSKELSPLALPRPLLSAPRIEDAAQPAEEPKDDEGDVPGHAKDMPASQSDAPVAVKEEDKSSSSLGQESLSSLDDSDKENIPPYEPDPLEFWLQRSPQFAVLGRWLGNSPEAPESGSNERGTGPQGGNTFSVLHPREPLATLLSFEDLAPRHEDSDEFESYSSQEDEDEPEYTEQEPGDYPYGYTFIASDEEGEGSGEDSPQQYRFPGEESSVTGEHEGGDFPYGYTFIDDDDPCVDEVPREHEYPEDLNTIMQEGVYESDDSDEDVPQQYNLPEAESSVIRGAVDPDVYPHGYTFIDDTDDVPQGLEFSEAESSRVREAPRAAASKCVIAISFSSGLVDGKFCFLWGA